MTRERSTHALAEDGSVRDWLAAGAWQEPVAGLSTLVDPSGSPWTGGRWLLTNGPDVTPLKAALYQAAPLRENQPLPPVVEGGEVGYTGPTGAWHNGHWRRVRTGSDGLVDWSDFCFTPRYRIALAGTVFEVDQADWRTLRVASTGPILLHVGGSCVARTTTVSYMEPTEHEVRVWLPSGSTEIVVCSWQVGFRECRQVVRLRVGGLPVRVALPSPGADEAICELAEQILDGVGTATWGLSTPEAELRGPDGAALRVESGGVRHRVRLRGGAATVPLTADAAAATGQDEVTVRVSLDDDRAPVFRDLSVAVLPSAFRDEPVGDRERWRRELLEHAATQRNGCAAELARAELDPTATVRAESLERPLWMINNRADCADFDALGLIHLWHRVPATRWPPDARRHVRDALLGLKYWIDQPGVDAMCYFTENHQIVWHTAELLAGQLFPGDMFGNTGWSGQYHAEHGRRLAERWLTDRLAGGFSEFDSNAYTAVNVLALVSLVEFARSERIAALAAGLLDKLLFTVAANSWRGAHVCAQGRSYVAALRSARFAETAAIMWVCWGVGALNRATLPAPVLATARRYTLPPVIAAAATPTGEWLGRQRYAGTYRSHHDLLSRPYRSELVVYKTPDAMLSCAQDYRPGLPGLQEHVWGAALGPEAQVYVTHPANDATHSSARPNAWAGNRILPRARQHRDSVLALYRIPPDDPMGHTHAWFPLSIMDEWRVSGSWLAARLGSGFVALATEGGCRVPGDGPHAHREIMAAGPGRAWVCVVGRHATDGAFDAFVAALGEPHFAPGAVRYETRHGETLDLAWDRPFTVNGRPVDLDADGSPAEAPHLDNPLCLVPFGATDMVIDNGEHRHVINLRTGRPVG